MTRQNTDDLLTPDEAAELLIAMKGRITPSAIRKRVREGELKSYHRGELAGRVFVKRKELLALYDRKIKIWQRLRGAGAKK